jgi:outer membrane protein assembly factor BamB
MTLTMQSKAGPWNQSRLALWLAAVLFPPLGFVLLWKRPGVGWPGRLVGSGLIAALALAHLVFIWGLRMELDGSASPTIVSFGDRESHYEEIERSRALQETPAAAQEPPPPAEPVTMAPVAQADTLAEPAPADSESYWTDYRGPRRDGIYTEMEILTNWPSDGLQELWRLPVGGGYASIVVANGRAFTIEQRRDQEVVAAYDMETGAEVWANAWQANFQESMGGPGPRSTPVWHDGRLYALGAEGEFRSIDAATGRTLWSRNILAENGASNLSWAMAASPLIVDDTVIVQPGGSGGKSVVAYDRLTGEPRWSALDDQQAYTSPMLVTLAGQRQILTVTRERAVGLTTNGSKVLWEYPWVTGYGVNAAQPLVIDETHIFLSAGYGHGAAMVELTPDGDRIQARTVWESNRLKNKFSTSVYYEGNIYGFDEAILACIDAKTGKLRWKGGRYGYGQVLLAQGHLVITTERGEVVLVRATPEDHQEVARFSAISGKTWNTPAIDGGRLLVRNAREMACYRIGR